MSPNELKYHNKKEVRQPGEPTKPVRQFIPAVDIYETEDAVTVRAEMPGVAKDNIEIDLEDGVLTIRGAMHPEVEGRKVLLREFENGNFYRRFTVAETIDQPKIEAAITEGMLTVTLPKMAPVKPRKIEIKTG